MATGIASWVTLRARKVSPAKAGAIWSAFQKHFLTRRDSRRYCTDGWCMDAHGCNDFLMDEGLTCSDPFAAADRHLFK